MEGGGGELKQKAMIKDKVKKGATALGDDVDSDDKLANMAYEDDEKKIGSGSGGNGKKSSNCSGGRGLMNICPVEGCMTDMSYAKPYHMRHKVCEYHAKAQVVVVAGIHKRFCQQCSSNYDDKDSMSYRNSMIPNAAAAGGCPGPSNAADGCSSTSNAAEERRRTGTANNCDDKDSMSYWNSMIPKEAAAGGWPGTTTSNAKGRT